jgi:hypothetical protein
VKITDSPYAAGTPEHSQWVREVYIPTMEALVGMKRWAGAEPELGSAASQGRRLIQGRQQDALIARGQEIMDRCQDELMERIMSGIGTFNTEFDQATNDFAVFAEGWIGFTGVPNLVFRIDYTP